MPKCQTNCIEKPISKGFEKLGHFVGLHPWWFLIFPLVLSAGLGGGFIFLKDREENAKGIENQFTPINGPAKEERLFVKENFPHNEEDFSRLRLYTEGNYASFIFTNPENILTDPAFDEIYAFNEKITTMQVGKQNFSTLCVKIGEKCMSNSILQVVNETIGYAIEYPFHNNIFLGSEIGGVKLNETAGLIISAKAIRLYYFLKAKNNNLTLNNMWLNEFMNISSQMKGKEVHISYFTSLSREEEFEKSSDSIIPLFSVTYVLAINFSIFSCLRLDCVRNKVWVAFFGVISAGLAVLSSFGLLLYCGMPFSMTVATAPFLILGIGVDDMFIMISCWQQTKVTDSVAERMAATYKDAAVSITITTLTDALAFYIGLLTPFRSVQSFCLYTGTAVVFCYIYNITFFGAFLALNGKREKSNRHFLSCLRVPQPQLNKYNICCVGGSYDKETMKEELMPVQFFFKKYYGPFLTSPWIKGVVVLLYMGYLATSIYGCLEIQEGIDLKNLATDSSYVRSYYDNEEVYFSEYGPSVMIVVTDTEFQYWNKTVQNQFNTCLQKFGNLTLDSRSMVNPHMTISWINEYLNYGANMSLKLDDKRNFIKYLPLFLNVSVNTQLFKQDLNMSESEVEIYASRVFIQTVNISTAVDEKNLLNKLRETAKSDECPGSLIVYHPAFIFYDQYAVIVSNTIQNIVVATLAMLVISLMLIPNPVCSLWVTFAIASVIVGVAGFMSIWDIHLDSVTMINLVICIGFSVDFSAHISFAFVSSKEPTANKKAIESLFHLGYPIIQGAVSTILGVVVLSASESYIFRTFFKIMLLVILFGSLHGIVFIPIFLTFFGICSSEVDHVKIDEVGQALPEISATLHVNRTVVTQRSHATLAVHTSVRTVQHNSNQRSYLTRQKTCGRNNEGFDPDCF